MLEGLDGGLLVLLISTVIHSPVNMTPFSLQFGTHVFYLLVTAGLSINFCQFHV